MSYNYNGSNISTYISGITSANYSNFTSKFANSGITSVSNDLGIAGISVVPSNINYSISGVDISTYSIAKYVDNTGLTQAGIPSWCNHLRVVMVSSGNSTTGSSTSYTYTYTYTYVYHVDTHVDWWGINNQDSGEYNHYHDAQPKGHAQISQVYLGYNVQQDQPLPQWDGGYQGYPQATHVHGQLYQTQPQAQPQAQVTNYYPGAGAFTYVDIQKGSLQTLQVGSNTININTYGIQLSNGQAASSGGNGSNGAVNLQGTTPQGVNYAVAGLFSGKKYSSGTLGQCGIKVFDAAATRASGDTSSSSNGFYRIYYLAS